MKILQIRRGLGLAALSGVAVVLASCAESAKDHVDRNNDGKLSNAEVDYALTEAVFYNADLNGDAEVTFDEWSKIFPDESKKKFVAGNPRGEDGYSEADVHAVFREKKVFNKLIGMIDSNGDGYIDEEEAGVFYDEYAIAPGDNEVQKLASMTGAK